MRSVHKRERGKSNVRMTRPLTDSYPGPAGSCALVVVARGEWRGKESSRYVCVCVTSTQGTRPLPSIAIDLHLRCVEDQTHHASVQCISVVVVVVIPLALRHPPALLSSVSAYLFLLKFFRFLFFNLSTPLTVVRIACKSARVRASMRFLSLRFLLVLFFFFSAAFLLCFTSVRFLTVKLYSCLLFSPIYLSLKIYAEERESA